MRHFLPLLCAALFAVIPVGAGGQSLYFDTNGDQVCTAQDILWGSDVNVDVYLDTNQDADGTPVTCASGEPLSILSYDLVFQGYSYRGSTWSFGTWTNAMQDYAEVGSSASGDQLWVAYSGAIKPPGRYKLGTLVVSSEPCSQVYLVPEMASTGHFTAFGSECPGANLDNTLRYGTDFASFCGAGGVCDGVRSGTWGMIKALYR